MNDLENIYMQMCSIKFSFNTFVSVFFLLLQTSASLKFTVLNPKGRIWTMVAGGGASVIYADTVSIQIYSSAYLQSRKQIPKFAHMSVFFFVYISHVVYNNFYFIFPEKKVGDLGYASELGNYAEYSGAPNEEEVLQYARVVLDVRNMICLPVVNASEILLFSDLLILTQLSLCHCCSQCATADPDGRKRALLIGGGIANFTDVAATFNGIIRALKEKVLKLF